MPQSTAHRLADEPRTPRVAEQYALALLVFVSGGSGEGPGYVNCREVQVEIAVAPLTGADLDEPKGEPIAICPARAAEQASHRQVGPRRGLAR